MLIRIKLLKKYKNIYLRKNDFFYKFLSFFGGECRILRNLAEIGNFIPMKKNLVYLCMDIFVKKYYFTEILVNICLGYLLNFLSYSILFL